MQGGKDGCQTREGIHDRSAGVEVRKFTVTNEKLWGNKEIRVPGGLILREKDAKRDKKLV